MQVLRGSGNGSVTGFPLSTWDAWFAVPAPGSCLGPATVITWGVTWWMEALSVSVSLCFLNKFFKLLFFYQLIERNGSITSQITIERKYTYFDTNIYKQLNIRIEIRL